MLVIQIMRFINYFSLFYHAGYNVGYHVRHSKSSFLKIDTIVFRIHLKRYPKVMHFYVDLRHAVHRDHNLNYARCKCAPGGGGGTITRMIAQLNVADG